MLANSKLGQLGSELFGDKNFFFSGIAGFGGGSSGGAGSSRGSGDLGKPRGKGNPDDKGVLTEEPEEGQYWVRQTSSVRLKGCHVQALEVLDCLGKFFYDNTGHKLVVTAGTNGRHAPGQYSHAAGWKLDVNDWYGPEGLQGGYITEGASFTNTFKKFGHDNGLGMADEGDHIDIQFADGYDWQDGQYYGGWDAVHGGSKSSIVDFLTNSLSGNITSRYGETRDSGKHAGIDIGASMGATIKSPVSGVVSKIGIEPNGYGNFLQIKDNNGKYHLFAHLKETPKLDLGNKIKAGDSIAFVGSSGNSSGPHLHYQIDPESNKEALKTGEHIDPTTYPMSDDLKKRIEENNKLGYNGSVADFKKYQELNKGDGGLMEDIKNRLEFSPKDYTDKFDAIIQLLTTMVQLLQGGVAKPAPAPVGDAMTAAIPIMRGADNMLTTTPGKSIMNIIGSMLKIAED